MAKNTVSRIINDAAGVKESTGRAVRRAIEELGYVPNPAARSLAGPRADAMALILTEPDWRQFAQPVISEIVRSLVGRADGHGDATAAPRCAQRTSGSASWSTPAAAGSTEPR